MRPSENSHGLTVMVFPLRNTDEGNGPPLPPYVRDVLFSQAALKYCNPRLLLTYVSFLLERFHDFLPGDSLRQ